MKVVDEGRKSTVLFIHLMLTLKSSISMAFQPRSEAGASGLLGALAAEDSQIELEGCRIGGGGSLQE